MSTGTISNGQRSAKAAPRKWYREPWPWLLMAGPAVAVLAGIFTTWLAVKSNDGLVADDYYKQGVAINKTLARDERARALGLQGSLELAAGETVLRLEAKAAVELPTRLHLVLSHATRAGLDRELILTGDARGWQGPALALPDGHWRVVVEDEAKTWRLRGNLRLPGSRQLTLGRP
ncbi:MAG: FixH family protein [Pseudomonadota bacterium]